MRRIVRASLVSTLLLGTGGCAVNQGVRYVYQDGEFGVVGIPQNTDRWPTYYRTQADRMMASHFPGGHEIVRAEEVIEGSRLLTTAGTRSAEIGPKLPADLITIAKLGASASRSQADQVKIREARIIYHRASDPAPSDRYSDLATQTPTQYIDPNAIERLRSAGKLKDDEKAIKLEAVAARDETKLSATKSSSSAEESP